jgi:hypothetical protein
MAINEEEKEIILLTAKCLINLYNQLLNDTTIQNYDDFERELNHIITASRNLISEARSKKVIIPKEDRYTLYDIIHH